MKGLDYTFEFQKCQKCGREFLVESILIGTPHTVSMIVTCKECLTKAPLPKEFIKQHPEEAKMIMDWLHRKDSPAP